MWASCDCGLRIWDCGLGWSGDRSPGTGYCPPSAGQSAIRHPKSEIEGAMRLAAILLSFMVAGWCAMIGFAAVAPPAAPAASPVSAADIEFFEKHVRPVLAESCYSCHGPKVQMAGLRLDTRAGVFKGSDRGAVIAPSSPQTSSLLSAVHYEGKVKMPPAGKLSAEAVAALEAWVKRGAAWPDEGAADASASPDLARTHWSFQPVRRPSPPSVKDKAWGISPIDAFVLARLESRALKPSPRADRRTLLRRATFDLTGLPPTSAEVDAFVADKSPDAFAKVVDRLLASPRYGERWGRYWLDVARYADTKGYVFNEERRYPYAYTYRDYVIRAFNADLPYDRFLIEQIAADRLPLGEDKRPLAAMGFLTLGRRFLNNSHDIIDDRIDVVTRGTLGLTVACARCHDHKFDPIPAADYYSLYGVFASSVEPKDLPRIGEPSRAAAYERWEKALNESEEAVRVFLDSRATEIRARLRGQAAEYLVAVHEAGRLADDEKRNAFLRSRELNAVVLRRWQEVVEASRKEHHPVFAPWIAFAALPEAEFAARAPALAAEFAANADGEKRVNRLVAEAFAGAPPVSLRAVAERYGQVFAAMEKLGQKQGETAPQLDAEQTAIRDLLFDEKAPPNVPAGDIERLLARDERNKLQALRREVDQVKASPDAPPHAMALEDAPRPANPTIFLRGNPRNRGPEVPRQFLAVLAGAERKPFQEGSGRLELARAIASKENPLTARVMVNRIWLHHFGPGLVRTPSDFGTRGEPPTHPELLDYLASRFMEGGWSIKQMHRLLMLSSTYQQRSDDHPRGLRADSENRLLWKMNRRRLDLEAMRDSLLAAAGKLDLAMGGPAVELTTAPFAPRRTVYGFIERQNLPPFFRTFDLASPDASSPQRHQTTVPQQALFMMNSPFVVEQARRLAARVDAVAPPAPEKRIQYLYRMTYGRWAAPPEVQLGVGFLQAAEAAGAESPTLEAPAWQYGYGEYDAAARRLRGLTPLPHWTGSVWQGGKEYPDETLAHLRLTATGGHAGKDARHAAIRRWVAPRGGVLAISGTLSHGSAEGDGVQAYAVSSRAGELGRWTAHDRQVGTVVLKTEVHRGDTIDFIVACRDNPSFDSFTWTPSISLAGPDGETAVAQWDAETGFRGPVELPPSLTAWERYAQVLLLSNEFMFVD